MRFPWQRATTFPELKAVVDSIPLRDLPTEISCFAHAASRTRDPVKRRRHMAKVQYGCERLSEHLAPTEARFVHPQECQA